MTRKRGFDGHHEDGREFVDIPTFTDKIAKDSVSRKYARYLWLRKRRKEIKAFMYEPFPIILSERHEAEYLPDYGVITNDFALEVHECKIRPSDHNLVKLKWAASLFPGNEFVVVSPRKSRSKSLVFNFQRSPAIAGGRQIPGYQALVEKILSNSL